MTDKDSWEGDFSGVHAHFFKEKTERCQKIIFVL
jgi:hypothetical protein